MAERPHDPRPRLRRRQRLGSAVRGVQRLRAAHLRRADDLHEPAVDHRSRRAAPPGGRCRDHRRAVRRRGEPPAGRPVRPARDPRGAVHVGLDQLAPARRRAVRGPRRSSTPATRTSSRPGSSAPTRSSTARSARSPRPAPSRSCSAATTRSRGRAPRAVAEVRAAGEHRHRPLRRPCRHRQRRLGRAGRPRHADAPPDRIGRGQGQELRPGRPARLLAAGRDVRVDAGAGPALPLHARDRGARRGGGRRPGDRGGARRSRLRST